MGNEFLVDDGGLDSKDWDAQAVGQHLAALMTGTTAAKVRGGVVPAASSPGSYVYAGGRQGILTALRYLVPSSNPAVGAYELLMPADTVFDHDTAHASQNRTDLIIAEVKDVGTTASYKKFRIVKGVAGSGAPTTNWTTPGGAAVDLGNGGWEALWSVNIPANQVALNGFTDLRKYAVAAGGMNSVPNLAGAADLALGTPFFDRATNRPGIVRASGPVEHVMPDTAWNSDIKNIAVAQGGIADAAWTTRPETNSSFAFAGGWSLIKAKVDITPFNIAAVSMRLAGDPASENTTYSNIRQTLNLTSMRYVPAGVYTLSCDAMVFAGTGYFNLNAITYQVYSLGSVVAPV